MGLQVKFRPKLQVLKNRMIDRWVQWQNLANGPQMRVAGFVATFSEISLISLICYGVGTKTERLRVLVPVSS